MKIKFPVIQWRTINISVEPKVETKVVEKAVEKVVEKPVTEPVIDQDGSISGWSNRVKPMGLHEKFFGRKKKGQKNNSNKPYEFKDGSKPFYYTRDRKEISTHPFWERLRGNSWTRATGKLRREWELKYHLYGAKFQFACETLQTLPPFTEEQILSQPKLFVKYLESKTKPKKYTNGYANGHDLHA